MPRQEKRRGSLRPYLKKEAFLYRALSALPVREWPSQKAENYGSHRLQQQDVLQKTGRLLAHLGHVFTSCPDL